MSFEERLLMELKTEIAAREAGRRRVTGRRLFAGAAVAGLAAAAAVAVPILTGGGSPAYAVSENADGTIAVMIHELRDADRLEGDLAELGVRADVTYVPAGKRCRAPRGDTLGEDAETPEEFQKSPSYLAAPPPRDGRLTIDPAHIGGHTLVLEFTERNPAERERQGMIAWRYAGWVMEGEVKPCELIDDPRWHQPAG